jgi:hypothetical protein
MFKDNEQDGSSGVYPLTLHRSSSSLHHLTRVHLPTTIRSSCPTTTIRPGVATLPRTSSRRRPCVRVKRTTTFAKSLATLQPTTHLLATLPATKCRTLPPLKPVYILAHHAYPRQLGRSRSRSRSRSRQLLRQQFRVYTDAPHSGHHTGCR